MKSIRNIAFTALLTLGGFTAITYTACNKDECKDVVCQNGGTCIDGTCSCATGYEGANCETLSRAKFLKQWAAVDQNITDNESLTYSALIVGGTAVTDVNISDFSDEYFDNVVKATVNGNTISIATQAPDNDGYTVEGTGTYNTSDKKITWSYTIKNPAGASISYSGTWN